MNNVDIKSNLDEGMHETHYLFKRVSLVDKYNFYDYIGIMVEGGVSITEALSSIGKKVKNPYFVSKLEELKMYISSGDSFSRAMKKIPNIFETSEIAIVEAGESTGNLQTVLMKLSDDLKKIHNLHLKIKGALAYPMIIFIILFIAILVVLTYVIPAITPIFETTGVSLPLATQLLLNTSDFIRNNFFALIFLFFGLGIGFLFYKNTYNGKMAISSFLLNLPLVGNVYKNYILSIFSSNLGGLIGSGVPVVKALNLVSKSINNIEYQNLTNAISESVAKGNKITESMQELDKEGFYFPSDFIQLFSVGEKTASLEQITIKISDQYTREVDYSLGNLTKWIEPLAILIAGVFVLWFAFAIFGAILKVTETVG